VTKGKGRKRYLY